MIKTKRIAMVTGGGRGLGRAVATRLAFEGWRVGILARTSSELEATVQSIVDDGGDAAAFPADVLDPAGLSRAFARLSDWGG